MFNLGATFGMTVIILSDETALNSERFIADRGMDIFLRCLEVFPERAELLRNMMGLIGNVAEVDYLRPRLMESRYVSIFRWDGRHCVCICSSSSPYSGFSNGTRASWTSANWTSANLTSANWTSANWTSANWTSASWTSASWVNSNWTNANWTSASPIGAC